MIPVPATLISQGQSAPTTVEGAESKAATIHPSAKSVGAVPVDVAQRHKGCCDALCAMLARLCCCRKKKPVKLEYPEGLTMVNLGKDAVGRTFASEVCKANLKFDIFVAWELSRILNGLYDPLGVVPESEINMICDEIAASQDSASLSPLCAQVKDAAINNPEQLVGALKQLLFEACIAVNAPLLANLEHRFLKDCREKWNRGELGADDVAKFNTDIGSLMGLETFKKTNSHRNLAQETFNGLTPRRQTRLTQLAKLPLS